MTTETKSETVQQIMTSNPQVVDYNSTVADALKLMATERYSSVPVVNGNFECVGILSRADLTEIFLAEDNELTAMIEAGAFHQLHSNFFDTCDDKLVREVMTHEVVTVTMDSSIQTVCNLMANHHIHHVPVVDSTKVIRGIVSSFDVINWFADS